MREIKFDIIFWDGADKDTIEHYTLQQAIGEDFVEFKDNEMIAPDECTIIRQYTGLKDKNGKEIYEGDIWKGLMDFGPGGFHERVVAVCDIIPPPPVFYSCLWEQGEVIGNIYENGELLNG